MSHIIKRTFDFIFSLILILILSPVFFFIVIILLINKHQIFFTQARPGLNGKIFKIYKFCTMANFTDSNGTLLPDHQRLTKVGRILRKTSLDELPQLLNVLTGKMSFVGPRPLLVDYLPLYNKDQRRRHSVKPGITGWAQINGRNSLSWEEKFTLDLWYVDNQSLMLDVKIIVMTVITIFSSKNRINSNHHVTMPKFKGTK